jgi:hypothetical protein
MANKTLEELLPLANDSIISGLMDTENCASIKRNEQNL